jgi:hypothetical protein
MLTLSSKAPPSQTWTIFFLITAIMVAQNLPPLEPPTKRKKKCFEFSLFEPTNPYLPPHPKQPC